MAKKVRIAVLYGGRSGEHEVSLRSAASVVKNLDTSRFEVLPIGIDKDGHWHLNDVKWINAQGKSLTSLPLQTPQSQTVSLPALPDPKGGSHTLAQQSIDVIFPVLHGPLYEDGALQGLLNLAEIAYVGTGVLGSAVGMDKELCKRIVEAVGVPVVPYLVVRRFNWEGQVKVWQERIRQSFGYPVFVKPANMGSSVGIHKVKKESELQAAVQDAFQYDHKVLIEQGLNVREIEFAVLENSDPQGLPLVSVPGEIIPSSRHEFYSYESKYLDEDGAALVIPAQLDATTEKAANRIAKEVFIALECDGLARVDLFVEKGSGKTFFNEVNTMPGFTSISMYPKLWEASGISYAELLSRLVDLALNKHRRFKALKRSFTDK